jgi:hypothetical protein
MLSSGFDVQEAAAKLKEQVCSEAEALLSKAENEARKGELQKARTLLAQEQERRLNACAQLTRAKQQVRDAEDKAKDAIDDGANATRMRQSAAALHEKEQVKWRKQSRGQEQRVRDLMQELREIKVARNAEAMRADEATNLLERQGTEGLAQMDALRQKVTESQNRVSALQQQVDASYGQVCSWCILGRELHAFKRL